MLRVHEVIVVEGRYDKIAVSQAVSATIIETSGFAVFSDGEKIALLRRLSAKRGLVILTDSDRAGFFIRGRLKGMFDEENIKHAYIPDIAGKERRKSSPAKDNKIGVEGMSPELIVKALTRAGAVFLDDAEIPLAQDRITKTDMYLAGLSGSPGSAGKRQNLLRRLDLPEHLSTNSLLDVLNILHTRDEFFALFPNSS